MKGRRENYKQGRGLRDCTGMVESERANEERNLTARENMLWILGNTNGRIAEAMRE